MASFTPTPGEVQFAAQVFTHADAKDGILRGDAAVRIFAGSKLPPAVLREIWNIADDENNGWLSRKGTAVALRLIGHAQKGEKVSAALISKRNSRRRLPRSVPHSFLFTAGPLAVIDGISPIASQNTGMSTGKPSSITGLLPPLTPQDRSKFQSMFQKAGPVNGLLSGTSPCPLRQT
jgi:epidermal growth factor receptor substrate 15